MYDNNNKYQLLLYKNIIFFMFNIQKEQKPCRYYFTFKRYNKSNM